MKETKNRAGRDIIVVGFALFSMFFGAGNVIFPPYLLSLIHISEPTRRS